MGYTGVTFRGSASGEIVKGTFTRDALKGREVLIKITHSGLCGTDLHLIHADQVLGHEGVGVIAELGPEATKFKVGDRVGWGVIYSTCHKCQFCLDGQDQYCTDKEEFMFTNTDQGSLGEISVYKEDWLFKIPDNVKSEHAAPLMCGGATVFTPLLEHCKPTDRVGIVGIGGLGHLAIQFAARMGCEVVVFSGTNSKREEALSMGAHEFYATKDVQDFATLNVKKPIDRLVVTTATLPDWEQYFKVLANKATVIPLTLTFGKMEIPFFQFLTRGYNVLGSILASRQGYSDMLDFCGRNKVFPVIEKFPLTRDGVTEAVEKLQSGKMRYRGVLTNEK
ncbi:NADP-dependent alcohol dehydrogenase [Cylindrobasidium torrendii FP15055 ss-10]|uniref:NADP-dependent alcohol dehydrogenase n=1 Tax=Cylindrobasidium torrendii FP15055 ss-10 TaxID=1314674 RepID=A0A0D7B3K0_9AGAR|nr:NADP-dependent alcohol dehydrogenase [Cylindrobasidium torrendii FP15055 ss-10]